jgi:hypothetical protein
MRYLLATAALLTAATASAQGYARDRDRDGVADLYDLCSNTPLGANAWTYGEWTGCSGGQYRDADIAYGSYGGGYGNLGYYDGTYSSYIGGYNGTYDDAFLNFQAAAVRRGYVYPTVHGGRIDYSGQVEIGGRLYPAGTTVHGGRIDYSGQVAIGDRLYPAGTTVHDGRIDPSGQVAIGGRLYPPGTTVHDGRIDYSGGIVSGGRIVYPGTHP